MPVRPPCTADRKELLPWLLTDYGTTYYLCDVVVDPSWQHKGVGRALLETIQTNPLFRDLRGILVSRDAQPFYAKFGFEKSDRGMVKPAKESSLDFPKSGFPFSSSYPRRRSKQLAKTAGSTSNNSKETLIK